MNRCILVKIFNEKNQFLNPVFTMYSSYFDFPRSAVLLVFFSSICSSSPSAQLGVIFPAQVSHKSYFGAQYSLLEIHFSVCATASSPPVHFSL
jgi:hypothetical protein